MADTNEENQVNVLSLSDEDVQNMTEPPTVQNPDTEVNTKSDIEQKTETVESNDSQKNTDSSDVSDDTPVQDEQKTESKSDEQDSTKPAGGSDVVEKPVDEQQQQKPEEKSTDIIDYKAAYDKLTAPFKANGINIQVHNIDEAITLMQMGANYHKKMATLKPSLKIVRMLEKNQLMDEGTLQFLIDLKNKDPQAIQKFMKESGIDPVDIDISAESQYTPKAQTVTDAEMQIQEVLEQVKDTPTFNRIISTITDGWDVPSRTIIAQNPSLISILNNQMGNGIFDAITSEVTRARALGQLQGVSDLDAYKLVGESLDKQGKLAQYTQQNQVTTQANVQQQNQVKQQQEIQRNARRQAAGAPTPGKTLPKQGKPVVNALALSDEEFAKMPMSAFSIVKE